MSLTLVPLVVAAQPPARGERDFDPTSPAWNGLTELGHVARRAGLILEAPERLDLATLTPNDAVLWVHPTRELPVPSLTAFLRSGGRFGLADDFGRGDSMLQAFHITRHMPPAVANAQRLRDHPGLLIAMPFGEHPLTQEVPALVTNHPKVLRHAVLEPTFILQDPQHAVVLVGAVGLGRLVALSDPSVLINNMLALDGNRRFASNLLRYLKTPHSPGRLLLITDATRVEGRFGHFRLSDPLDPLHRGFARLAALPVSPVAIRTSTWVLVGVLVMLVLAMLPRRSPYRRPPYEAASRHTSPRPRASRQTQELLYVIRLFKSEFENEMLRLLGLSDPFDRHQVMRQLQTMGLASHEAAKFERLWVELENFDRLHARVAPRLLRHRFVAIVSEGQGMLKAVQARCP